MSKVIAEDCNRLKFIQIQNLYLYIYTLRFINKVCEENFKVQTCSSIFYMALGDQLSNEHLV